jgi:hypothetical protein
MNQTLATLVKSGVVGKQEAIEHSPVPEELAKVLGGLTGMTMK